MTHSDDRPLDAANRRIEELETAIREVVAAWGSMEEGGSAALDNACRKAKALVGDT